MNYIPVNSKEYIVGYSKDLLLGTFIKGFSLSYCSLASKMF